MPDIFTWTFDAENGVYKNHALSGRMLEAAARKFQIVTFTKKVPDFGRKMGESVTLMHYKPAAEPVSAQLAEGTRIPIDKLQMGSRSLKVLEWGRGVQYTSLAQDLSAFDPKTGAQKVLVDQMNAVMDTAAATAFKQAKCCFIPTSATGGTMDTDGTPSTQATVNLTKAHMGVLRDYMANDLHVPFYEGNHFIGLFATKALRGLKNDAVLEAWHQYLQKGDFIFNSEVGQCESIRCIEVNHEQALSNSVGAGGILGEGVVFGDEAVARVEVEFPHLRADPNYQGDFGRVKACCWYGTVSFGTHWDTANDREAKIVRVCSQ